MSAIFRKIRKMSAATVHIVSGVIGFGVILIAYLNFIIGRLQEAALCYVGAFAVLTPYLVKEYAQLSRQGFLRRRQIAKRFYQVVSSRLKRIAAVYLSLLLGAMGLVILNALRNRDMLRVYLDVNPLGWIAVGALVFFLLSILVSILGTLTRALPSSFAALGFVAYYFTSSHTALVVWVVSSIIALLLMFRTASFSIPRSIFHWIRELALLSTLIVGATVATSPLLPSPFYGGEIVGYVHNYFAADYRLLKLYLLNKDQLRCTYSIKLSADRGKTDHASMTMLEKSMENLTTLSAEARSHLKACLQILGGKYRGTQLDLIAEMRLAYLDYFEGIGFFCINYGCAFIYRNPEARAGLDHYRSLIKSSWDSMERLLSEAWLLQIHPHMWDFGRKKKDAMALIDVMYDEALAVLAGKVSCLQASPGTIQIARYPPAVPLGVTWACVRFDLRRLCWQRGISIDSFCNELACCLAFLDSQFL